MINLLLKDCATLRKPDGAQRHNFNFGDLYDVGGDLDDISYGSGVFPNSDDFDGTSFDDIVSTLEDISLYSSYSAYSGVIPEPYLTYFSSLYANPEYVFSDYVAFVTHESSGSYTSTVYNMFISDDLVYNGGSFSGSGTLYKYYTSSRFPTFVHSEDSSFYLSVGSGAVFTSLPSAYPDFTVPYLSSRYALYALFFGFLIFSFLFMFHVKHSTRR